MIKYVVYAKKKYKVVGVTGKYYLCEKGKMFRILNPNIAVVMGEEPDKQPKKKKPLGKEKDKTEEVDR